MTNPDARQNSGCAVCNPAQREPIEEMRARHRKEATDVLHIVQMGAEYHVLQIPGEHGKPCTHWMGPFRTERAANMFRDSLIENAFNGNAANACCSDGIAEYFDLLDGLQSIIEAHDGNAQSLASRIASEEPWNPRRRATARSTETDDIPF